MAALSWALSAEEQDKMKRKQLEDVARANASANDSDNPSAAESSLFQKVVRKGLIETKCNIEIQRKDPKSPLYHVKTFEELHLKPELLSGLHEMGYTAPSKIQETTLPSILADPPINFIAQSQSGTGKTAAFVLAMLSRVDVSKRYPHILCLSPTYELAVQTAETAFSMAKFITDIKFSYALRGEEVTGVLSEHIIIGTPGKVLDWGLRHKLFDLKKIEVFVLDEADVMISQQGHHDQVQRLRKHLNPKCQMLLFSATYDKQVMEFAESIISNAITLTLPREEQALDNIKQYYVQCQDENDKYRAITNIYGIISIGQAIIFCQTRRSAKWLADEMTKDGHSVAMLSAELTVEERINVLDKFRALDQKVLITTNVLSRGIDIETVNLVVNFHLPVTMDGQADCDTYLHRIGRTGRFGKPGVAVNLIETEKDSEVLNTIQTYFGKVIHSLNVKSVKALQDLQPN